MSENEVKGVGVDLLAGGVMLAICAAFVITAWGYGIGTPARMGPGFFPFSFGLVGMGLALAIILRSFIAPSSLREAPQWRAACFVISGVVAFGLLIETVGLGPAVFVSTIISAYADREARLKGTVVLAIGLAAATWLVFVYLLGLSIPFIAGVR
ncbi:MAG TPA: tripartite tricarboxylate transporter TctB family protein [Rhizobiaceae bacterium]|nr:tripartite tricarboxylate transporter TctB family protein [Rhizobiaceae bacterium]